MLAPELDDAGSTLSGAFDNLRLPNFRAALMQLFASISIHQSRLELLDRRNPAFQ
jgi:hypothetical protein